jgi:hypothetical protein
MPGALATTCIQQSVMRHVHSARWLIDNFSPELMASGAGLLDVAGGMGELSWELMNLNGLPSTVMDPRPLDPKDSLRKLRVSSRHVA